MVDPQPVNTPDNPNEHTLIDPEDPCQNLRCTRLNGRCVGYHCDICGEPSSIYGHAACQDRATEERANPDIELSTGGAA
jgi:hypothetical protein